jgi:hypothetical protein
VDFAAVQHYLLVSFDRKTRLSRFSAFVNDEFIKKRR